ncbi:MAG: MFS transporter, NNP family, nitrate/nitrite transporter, partial [bacterium]
CWLYLGTFGSFIGYSAAFPRLIKSIFEGVDPLQFAFLGPLVGALARPVGGWMSDRWGGARVTFWNFLAMMAAAGGVIHFVGTREFTGFLVLFLLLFTTAGIGNASTFRMIPIIFLNQSLRRGERTGTSEAVARRAGSLEASAILGFSSAIGAYGGFIIPIAFGNAIKAGNPGLAMAWFLAFYATCLALTWWYYYRRNAEAPC